MYRLFLAFRFLLGRPFSWVAMIGIWLTVTALLCTVAIMSGFLDESSAVIRGTTSDIVVTPRSEWRPDGSLAPPPAAGTIQALVAATPGVAGASPRVLRPALLAVKDAPIEIARMTPDDPNVLQVIGVDPAAEAGASRFQEYVANGSLGAAGAADLGGLFDPPDPVAAAAPGVEELPVVLLGRGLAERFGLVAGDTISLVTLGEDVTEESAAARSRRFVVKGTVRTGHFQNDRTSVFTSLEAARDLAATRSRATEICVRVAAGAELGAVADALEEALAGAGLNADVETWYERHAVYLSSVDNQRSILGFLLFFFVALACFNVFASLTILVHDKVRDIGILAAMGASRGGIAGIFLVCAVLLAATGSVLGAATGALISSRFDQVNEGIERLFGVRIFRPDIYLFDHVPARLEPWFIGAVFLATLVLAVLFALLPALRAARMDPVRALRYE